MFRREERYVVLKANDIEAALNDQERSDLIGIMLKVDNWRGANKKPDLVCVVVESDWPEYEPTWRAIENRMNKESES